MPSCLSMNRVFLVSFDGFRYDYLDTAKQLGRNISAFENVIERGFRGRVVPIMPTITFPTHYATVTGRYSQHHGIMSNVFYAPDINATFNYKNLDNNADSRFWDFNDNEPIWITNQRHDDRTSCTYFWIGSFSTYGGKLPTKSGPKYNESIPVKDRIDQIIAWMDADDHMTFCALYVNEPDVTGHRYGPNSTQVMDKIEELNNILQYMIDKINASPKLRGVLNLIITSDHGMVYVPEQNKIPIYDIVRPDEYIPNLSNIYLGLWPKPGRNYFYITH